VDGDRDGGPVETAVTQAAELPDPEDFEDEEELEELEDPEPLVELVEVDGVVVEDSFAPPEALPELDELSEEVEVLRESLR
jgi:hypothetical protein